MAVLAQMALLAMLSCALGPGGLDSLRALPGAIAAALEQRGPARRLVQSLGGRRSRVLVVG